jgi:hypothetical protein
LRTFLFGCSGQARFSSRCRISSGCVSTEDARKLLAFFFGVTKDIMDDKNNSGRNVVDWDFVEGAQVQQKVGRNACRHILYVLFSDESPFTNSKDQMGNFRVRGIAILGKNYHFSGSVRLP